MAACDPPGSVSASAPGFAAAITAAKEHSCAIQAGTGAVICWGNDVFGQASPPALVDGITGSASAISAGGDHSCAIQAGTGAVICWGDDFSGQASPPESVDGTTGTASAIAAGGASLAIAVPEPDPAVLALTALATLAAVRCGRNSRRWYGAPTRLGRRFPFSLGVIETGEGES